MTLRESHQICQLDLVTLTEPLQAYIPKEEDIQIPLKKLEANSEAPITTEATVQPENTEDSSTNPKPDEPTTEILPESEESPKTEEQNTPVETTNEPTDESVSDPPEMTQTPAESVSESVQTPSETVEPSSDPVEATIESSETTAEDAKTENKSETDGKETKND